MHRKHLVIIFSFIVLFALVLPGCSNQNSSTSSTQSTDQKATTQKSSNETAQQPPTPTPQPYTLSTTTPAGSDKPAGETAQTPTTPTETDSATPTEPEKIYAPVVGSYAPPFELITLKNEKISLAQFLGKPVILMFWASWCAKCNATAPELNKFYAKHMSDVQIIGINLYGSDTLDAVQKYIERHAITYAIAPDTTGDVATRYRATQTSTYFVIDGQGIITDIFSYQTLSAKDFETAYAKAAHVTP